MGPHVMREQRMTVYPPGPAPVLRAEPLPPGVGHLQPRQLRRQGDHQVTAGLGVGVCVCLGQPSIRGNEL